MKSLKEVVEFMNTNLFNKVGEQVKVEVRDKDLILNQIGSVQVAARFSAESCASGTLTGQYIQRVKITQSLSFLKMPSLS